MKNLRLKFADSKNYRFSLMCTDLNSLIQRKFPGKIFFVKAEKECLSRFSGNFFGPPNRISGWLIDESQEDIFKICLIRGISIQHGTITKYQFGHILTGNTLENGCFLFELLVMERLFSKGGKADGLL